MTRPLRIEFPGAIYHVTSRGVRQAPIYLDDDDRRRFLAILEHGAARFDAELFAYCLMGNHFHLVVRTRQANLARLMRHVNGEYGRSFNRAHDASGHVFQGRYHAVLVASDDYLLQACRYVELNPVRANLVPDAASWPWSSHRSNVGLERSRAWLATLQLHQHLQGVDIVTPNDIRQAARQYAQYVLEGLGVDLWAGNLRDRMFLGDESFVADMLSKADKERLASTEIATPPPRDAPSLAQWTACCPTREEAFRRAYLESGMTMKHIASESRTSLASVSRMIARAEAAICKT